MRARATMNLWPWAHRHRCTRSGLAGSFSAMTNNEIGGRASPRLRSARTGETMGAGSADAKLTDITAELTSSVRDVRAALVDMTDPVSVQAALPKLAAGDGPVRRHQQRRIAASAECPQGDRLLCRAVDAGSQPALRQGSRNAPGGGARQAGHQCLAGKTGSLVAILMR